MPYIKPKQRPSMDKLVETMLESGVCPDGTLNYVLFKLAMHACEKSYSSYKSYIGELNECVAEIRRRIMVPHEEKKIKQNGDIC